MNERMPRTPEPHLLTHEPTTFGLREPAGNNKRVEPDGALFWQELRQDFSTSLQLGGNVRCTEPTFLQFDGGGTGRHSAFFREKQVVAARCQTIPRCQRVVEVNGEAPLG